MYMECKASMHCLMWPFKYKELNDNPSFSMHSRYTWIYIPLQQTTEIATTEELITGPTDDPDDEDSDSSESSDSEETSFSDSETSDSDISGKSGTTRTNSTRSMSGRSGMSKTTSTENSDSESSDSRSNSRCQSVRKLLAKGCTRGCILEDSDGCPACNHTCLGKY